MNPDCHGFPQACAGWQLSDLFYFATPHITPSVKGGFSSALFDRFCKYYVTGFSRTLETLRPFGLQGVFYPSTVYVDELPPNLAEYAAAKMAGETLCRSHEKNFPGIKFYYPRLPRLATDQTASLIRVKTEEHLVLMTQTVRQFMKTDSPR